VSPLTTSSERNRRQEPELPEEQPTSARTTPGDDEIGLSADALYEQGMTHYRRREWRQAKEAFARLQKLQPDRRGISALLDEINIFLRLQSLEPQGNSEAETPEIAQPARAARDRFATRAAPRRRTWWPWALAAGLIAAIAIVAMVVLPPLMSGQSEAQRLWIQGQAHYNSGNYARAAEVLEELVAMAPTAYDIQANALLGKARKLRDVKLYYNKAQESKAQEQWTEAAKELEAFAQTCQQMGNIPETDLRRACQGARDEIPTLLQKAQLADLYKQGRTAYVNQDWGAAAEAFQRVRELDPEYKKDEVRNYLFASYLTYGTNLIEAMGNSVDEVELAKELFDKAAAIRQDDSRPTEESRLAADYLAALKAFYAEDWGTVRARLHSLDQQRPGYAGGRVTGLLCTANVRLGDQAYERGDGKAALAYYREVLAIEGCDHSEAEIKERKLYLEMYPLTATPTATSTPTATLAPTHTPTPTVTRVDTATPTVSRTRPPLTKTPTATPTPRPLTSTPRPPTSTPRSPTKTPRPRTNTPRPPTKTPTRTNTPRPPTKTPTRTNTPRPPTKTPTRTNTPRPPTKTPTRTNTPRPPTNTPAPTATATLPPRLP